MDTSLTTLEYVITAIFSIVTTFLLLYYFICRGDKEQLGYMRSDGLSDEEIIDICGKEWFERAKN